MRVREESTYEYTTEEKNYILQRMKEDIQVLVANAFWKQLAPDLFPILIPKRSIGFTIHLNYKIEWDRIEEWVRDLHTEVRKTDVV
ncbi:MAG: hypothetical protein DRO18_04805 [Thermoprotei archaeon]|nr:MAG: hypothetical protein DRO18_04805 [Thermoprotei archaeon]